MGAEADRRIAEVALAQHGAFTYAQARSAGFSGKMIRQRRESGRWTQLHPDVCCVTGTPPTLLRDISAATLARPGALVSHASGARLHRVSLIPPGPPTLSGSQHHEPLDGVRLRRRRDLDRCVVVRIAGLPVTDLATTLFDLAADLGRQRYERVIDDQLSAHRVGIDQLATAFERHARRGREGTARAREVLAARAAGQVITESELEALFRSRIAPLLPIEPTYQFLPPWRTDGIGRVDVAFPAHRFLVELDGRRWHARDEQWEEDHRRDQAALMHGWRTARFTYRQVRAESEAVAQTIISVLDLSGKLAF